MCTTNVSCISPCGNFARQSMSPSSSTQICLLRLAMAATRCLSGCMSQTCSAPSLSSRQRARDLARRLRPPRHATCRLLASQWLLPHLTSRCSQNTRGRKRRRVMTTICSLRAASKQSRRLPNRGCARLRCLCRSCLCSRHPRIRAAAVTSIRRLSSRHRPPAHPRLRTYCHRRSRRAREKR